MNAAMKKVMGLVNAVYVSPTMTSRFFLQSATSDEMAVFPFGDSVRLEAGLVAYGAQVQQNDGKRMLVNHAAWVSVDGVVTSAR